MGEKKEKITIYTDGSGIIDSGKYYGGYGVIVYMNDDEAHREGKMVLGATNNTMELRALHDAIVLAKKIAGEYEVEICSDSQYALNIIAKIEDYKQAGWATASTKKTKLKNLNHLLKIYDELQEANLDKIKFVKVKAHDSDYKNNQVDKLARENARLLKKAFDKNKQCEIEFVMDWEV